MIVKRMHDFVKWNEKQVRLPRARLQPPQSVGGAARKRLPRGPPATASVGAVLQLMPSFRDYFATVQESLSPTSALPADSSRLYGSVCPFSPFVPSYL